MVKIRIIGSVIKIVAFAVFGVVRVIRLIMSGIGILSGRIVK